MKHNNNIGINVPNLRFSEFKGKWEKTTLGNISEYVKDRVRTCSLSPNNYISTENLIQDFQGVAVASSVPQNVSVTSYRANDILFSNIRPYLKKSWKADMDGGCSADVFVFRYNETCLPDFLYYLIANDAFINYVMTGAKGVKMPRGDKQQIERYPVCLPTKLEQAKIAAFISLLDERISTQNKIIEKLEFVIKGLSTISQKHTWSFQLLKDLLNERKEQNTNGYAVFSVAVKEGLVDQVKHLGRSFAAKDTSDYNVVKFGDIVYTKSPTGHFPYGIIKQSHVAQSVAVSPLYGVYKPKNIYIGNILHNYFSNPINTNNYLHSLIQKGAKNTINISSSHFLDKGVLLPSDNTEIENLSRLITYVRQKIDLERDVLNQLNNQKYFLMKEMFK